MNLTRIPFGNHAPIIFWRRRDRVGTAEPAGETGAEELSLTQILDDPITMALMEKDGVSRDDITELLRLVRRHRHKTSRQGKYVLLPRRRGAVSSDRQPLGYLAP